MAKEIRQWKTDDGKIFDSQEEAEKHESKQECEQEERKQLAKMIDGDDREFGGLTKVGLINFIIRHKPELLDILYLKGQYTDIAFTRENLLETAGLSVEKSKNGKSKKGAKSGPELSIKKPAQSSSSKSRTPVKLVSPEVLARK